jgi:hypothetical protein
MTNNFRLTLNFLPVHPIYGDISAPKSAVFGAAGRVRGRFPARNPRHRYLTPPKNL